MKIARQNQPISSVLKALLATLLICMLAQFAAAQQRLLVVGGGERPPEAMKRFVEWSGGANARILVVTWASGVPAESFTSLEKGFVAAGAANIVHAPVTPLDDDNRTEFIEQLKSATGIFFSGGDQNRIMDVLSDQGILNSIRSKYNTGTPIGGTSAGAAAMSDPMITGEADLKILDGKKVGTRKGMGLVENVIFDQHFLVRQRHNRLFGLVIENPTMLGIGIDEDTAVLIEDNRRLTVSGKTQVMLVNSKNRPGEFSLYILRSGEKFDLVKRRIER